MPKSYGLRCDTKSPTELKADILQESAVMCLFVPSQLIRSLSFRSRGHFGLIRKQPSRCPRNPTRVVVRAVTVADAISEVAVLGVLAGTVYFFLSRDDFGLNKVSGKTLSEEGGIEGIGGDGWKEENGIIGFRSMGKRDGEAGGEGGLENSADGNKGSKLKFRNAVGHEVVSDFLESDEGLTVGKADLEIRRTEELRWAGEELLDLPNAGGVAVFDAQGNALLVTGEMARSAQGLRGKGSLPGGMRGLIRDEQQEWASFLEPLIERPLDIVAEDVGDTGAVVLVTAKEGDVFGERDLRVLKAISARLAYFVNIRDLTVKQHELSASEER